jgi:DNA-binding transcriptional LysR family regulator
MNLRFVEAFYWVVMLRSVTRAAEKLHLTQSAISSRMAVLEQELGTLLLDRRDKALRVTAAGQRFFGYAERLLALQSELRSELGGAAPQPVQLRVGAIESVLHSWLMDWVRGLRQTHPTLALELAVETSPVLVDQLVRGTLDIALAALPAVGTGVRSLPLPPMAMVFTGHSGRHRRRRWALEDLAQTELLTFQRGSQPHVALLDLLNRAGLQAQRVHCVSSISAMAQLVEDGLGVATLPAASVRRLAQRLPLRPLACDALLQPLPIHLSWRDDPASPSLRTLVDSILQHQQAQALPAAKAARVGAAKPAR